MTASDEEFVAFVRGASPRLLRAAWFICGDRDDAEDLVQAALEKVYARWHRLHDDQPLAYARRCLLTQHVDATRRRRREKVTDRPPEIGGEPPLPEDTAYLVSALATLSARERQIVVMRYYADMSEYDVADALRVSTGTVKSTASRALAKVRESLGTEEDSYVR